MRKELSQILEEKFNVSPKAFNEARDLGKEQNLKVSEVLIKKNVVTEAQFLQAVGEQYRMPFWPDLPPTRLDSSFTSKVSIQFLKKNFMVPLLPLPGVTKNTEESTSDIIDLETASGTEADGNGHSRKVPLPDHHVIAVNDPLHVHQLDDLVRLLNIDHYETVLSTRDSIVAMINRAYDLSRDSAQQLVQDMEESSRTIISEIEETADLLDDTSDSQIIKLVNHIISQSIKARASDIHIEPFQESFKVRYRVDGILYDLLKPPKWIQSALISRIKVMAKLNIAEKRLPQDGRIDVRIGENDVDIRVSTVPTTFGERVVLRLLSKAGALLTLTEFGLSQEKLDTLESLIHQPNGIILVTGPTGSGKTTTLYAILSAINSPEINIITIEDPIEYQLNGIGQIQVNPKIDLTFASGLRSIVRQDPDVILIGEIRDGETAEIAIQSALTGHLVFSTLHTNDSASAITRLVDIGMEPFLLSSALNAVVAQRLVRTLCTECREEYRPDANMINMAGLPLDKCKNIPFFRPKGCDNCFHTGYKGRVAIMEIMVMDQYIKSLILKTSDSNVIKTHAIKRGMKSLRIDGLKKLVEGITSIEEVLRVTHG